MFKQRIYKIMYKKYELQGNTKSKWSAHILENQQNDSGKTAFVLTKRNVFFCLKKKLKRAVFWWMCRKPKIAGHCECVRVSAPHGT